MLEAITGTAGPTAGIPAIGLRHNFLITEDIANDRWGVFYQLQALPFQPTCFSKFCASAKREIDSGTMKDRKKINAIQLSAVPA